VPVRLVISAGCPLAREGGAGNAHDQGHRNPRISAAYVRMLTNVTNKLTNYQQNGAQAFFRPNISSAVKEVS
jgi:hypothetical protein